MFIWKYIPHSYNLNEDHAPTFTLLLKKFAINIFSSDKTFGLTHGTLGRKTGGKEHWHFEIAAFILLMQIQARSE